MARERRKHVVYLTRNSEYHCREQECVAVRNRQTGKWQRLHAAVRSVLIGSADRQRVVASKEGEVGMRLCFNGERPVLTSRVEMVGRPDRSAVTSYTSLCWAGAIEA